jgi:hypothetical protein
MEIIHIFRSLGGCLFSPKNLTRLNIYVNLKRQKWLTFIIIALAQKDIDKNRKILMKNKDQNKLFSDMQETVVKKLEDYTRRNPDSGFHDVADLMLDLPPVDYIIPKIPPNSELHHYTSVFALQNIITNGEFWLTRGDFLNDRQEVMYFGDSAIKLLEALKATETMDEDFIISLQYNLHHYSSALFSSQFYILSLALDNDSLGMWNYYGKNDGYWFIFSMVMSSFVTWIKAYPYLFYMEL